MLFDDNHYGTLISEELSTYLQDWTTRKDWSYVCFTTGVSMSTIRDVVKRVNSLTENNSKAIIELMRAAVKNCTNKINYAKEAKKELQKWLEQDELTKEDSILQETGSIGKDA